MIPSDICGCFIDTHWMMPYATPLFRFATCRRANGLFTWTASLGCSEIRAPLGLLPHARGRVCPILFLGLNPMWKKWKNNFGSYLGSAHLIPTVSSYIYRCTLYIYIYQTHFGGPMLAELSKESLDSRFSRVSSLFLVCMSHLQVSGPPPWWSVQLS